MIDQSTIEKINDAAQITEVVSEFVTLKRRGVNYLGVCPFHDEKTPSFIVSPAKGIFKCFGCGKGGNSVNFIMEHENLSYVEALKYLARKYHIEIAEKEVTPEQMAQQNERESLMLVSEFAGNYFMDILHNNTEGKTVGLSYFKERGIRDEMITRFQLGYSLEKRDAFTEHARKQGFKIEFLEKTGLTIVKENWQFDRFAGRVMFPIHGLSGKVIGFGGRILKADKSFAKYQNSIESEIYHKSKVLYGMFQSKNAIVKSDKCYLVEGYTDVISMHQAGIENVVASSGTSLTEQQITLIKRFTNNVTILYDGDSAGIKASLRGIDMVLEQGLNVKVLLLPDGDDPDSFAQKHSASEVIEYIAKNESDFVIFKTRLLMGEAQKDPIKRATLITDIVQSIAIVPDTIVRSVYIKECASILQVDERILYTEINKIRKTKHEQNTQTNRFEPSVAAKQPIYKAPVIENSANDQIEREIIRLLLQYGDNIMVTNVFDENQHDYTVVTVAHFITSEIKNDDLEFSNPLYKRIFDEFAHKFANNIVDYKYFANHPDQEISSMVAGILTRTYDLSKIWKSKTDIPFETEEMKLPDMVPSLIMDYKNKKVMSLLREAQLQLLGIQKDEDEEQILELQLKIVALNNYKKTMAVNLGNRTILH